MLVDGLDGLGISKSGTPRIGLIRTLRTARPVVILDVEPSHQLRDDTLRLENTMLLHAATSAARAIDDETYGLPMGLKASVTQFNRPMALMTYFANAAMLCPATHYYDDVNIADTAQGKGTAQRSTDATFKAWTVMFRAVADSACNGRRLAIVDVNAFSECGAHSASAHAYAATVCFFKSS